MAALESRFVRIGLLVAACALFLETRVFMEFAPIRAKVVTAPLQAADGMVRAVATPQKLKDLRTPFAVVARLENASADVQRFSIEIDATVVCDASVAGRSTARIDCTFAGTWDPTVPHEARVRGATSDWRLDFMELSTHYGSSSGVLNLVVLPSQSRNYASPSQLWIAVLCLMLAGVLLLPPPWMPWWLSVVEKITFGLLVLWCIVFLLSPWVSRYALIAGGGSFVQWLLLVLTPRIVAPSAWGASRAER